jgi:hypothetical protein
MYDVSQTWQTLIADELHWFEVKVVIDEDGTPINVPASSIFDLSIQQRAFSGEQPTVGACLSAEIDLKILRPGSNIPRMASISPYVCVTNGTTTSEWIPQGKFFIDTREYSQNDDSLNVVTIHGYDSMLKTEDSYPDTTHAWPMSDIAVVNEIATTIGVSVDPRTTALMTNNYQISAPAGYSMREVLGNIAAMYCGNFIMNYDGELLLVTIDSYPPETSYIVTGAGNPITFGGDRILVSAI